MSDFKVKTRKRAVIVKHEPEAFRDSLLELIPEDSTNIEEYAKILEESDTDLDYKRYGVHLFEVLIVGGLIGSGGIIEKGPRLNPFSIIATDGSRKSIEKIVKIFVKLIRRLKYLQRKLEDCLSHLLQYLNKFSKEDIDKISLSVALLSINQVLSISIISVTRKDHLLKDGLSLQFLDTIIQTYISDKGVDYLGSSFRKAGLEGTYLEYFPPNKTDEDLIQHFKSIKLDDFSTYYQQRQRSLAKETLIKEIAEELDTLTPEKLALRTTKLQKSEEYSTNELLTIIWDGLIRSFESKNYRPDVFESQLIILIKKYGKVLELFSQTAKQELEFLRYIQEMCYNNPSLMKHYLTIIKALYDEDVVTESAILYWYGKGASSQGKSYFIGLLEPFITWLKEQDDDDEEEDDDE